MHTNRRLRALVGHQYIKSFSNQKNFKFYLKSSQIEDDPPLKHSGTNITDVAESGEILIWVNRETFL